MNSFTTTSAYAPSNIVDKRFRLFPHTNDGTQISIDIVTHVSQSDALVEDDYGYEHLGEYSYSVTGLKSATYTLKEFDSNFQIKYTYQMKLIFTSTSGGDIIMGIRTDTNGESVPFTGSFYF